MRWIAAILLFVQPFMLLCQQSDPALHVPASYLQKLDRTTTQLNTRLTRATEKYLQRMLRCEQRLQQKLAAIDSAAAAALADPAQAQYKKFIEDLQYDTLSAAGSLSGEYLPYIDSLNGGLAFLQQQTGPQQQQLIDSRQQFGRLVGNLQQADVIKQYISQRRNLIKQYLQQYTQLPAGVEQQYRRLCREVYYYQQQVQEYKQLLNDPGKWLPKVLAQLNRLPAFRDFMRNYSQLAGLFELPGGYASASVPGMQNRDEVLQVLQSQLGSGGPRAQQVLQQGVQAAQAPLADMKERLLKGGSAGLGDDALPEFKPNRQRTRSFLQRLELGTNLQTARSDRFFPTTTDIAVSVGYKLNDRSTLGIGASYKLGWGKDIRHVAITSEGAGIRSFLDLQLKGSFYASGGFEYNYQPCLPLTPSGGGDVLQPAAWRKSGLAGVSKIVSLKSKLFKKTKLQLFWDFLSYGQTPRTQAVKFRIGYTF